MAIDTLKNSINNLLGVKQAATDRSFASSEAAKGRTHDAFGNIMSMLEAKKQRGFQADETQKGQEFMAGQNELDRSQQLKIAEGGWEHDFNMLAKKHDLDMAALPIETQEKIRLMNTEYDRRAGEIEQTAADEMDQMERMADLNKEYGVLMENLKHEHNVGMFGLEEELQKWLAEFSKTADQEAATFDWDKRLEALEIEWGYRLSDAEKERLNKNAMALAEMNWQADQNALDRALAREGEGIATDEDRFHMAVIESALGEEWEKDANGYPIWSKVDKDRMRENFDRHLDQKGYSEETKFQLKALLERALGESDVGRTEDETVASHKPWDFDSVNAYLGEMAQNPEKLTNAPGNIVNALIILSQLSSLTGFGSKKRVQEALNPSEDETYSSHQ